MGGGSGGGGAYGRLSDDEGPDDLEKEIAERTRRNPDYPRLLAEAERARVEEREREAKG